MAASLQSGFVLTRKTYDTSKGMVISLWLITKDGPVNLQVTDEKAIFFIEQSSKEKAIRLLKENGITPSRIVPLALKSFQQQPISGVYFDYIREFYQARDVLKQHKIKCYEDDIRPEERYLMERFITDNAEFSGIEKHTINSALTLIHGKCKKGHGQINLKMVSVDIECSPKGELYSIGLYAEKYQCVMMIADKPDPKEGYDYIEWLTNEPALLTRFVQWVGQFDPDIFIGWNVINFDFSLLQKRFDLHNIPFAIGRDNREPSWRTLKSSEQRFIGIAGRVVVDGIDLLKTATYNFPSFSLDNVARELLGKSKKVEDVENRLKEIVDNFHHDKHALAAYNLEDCKLVWEIFEHTQLLNFAMLRSKLTGLTLDRVGGSVAAFTNLYLPKLHRSGYIAPNLGDGKSDLVSPGGYVMDSTPGLYNNILVLDFKSLYPSIIRTFFIDPMGLIEGLKSPTSSVEGFDEAYFSRDKHFLPAIIDELWHERDKAKLENNSALSQAIKIIMNSFYGVLGSTGCRFFDPRLSGSITKRGHEILKTTQKWIEEEGFNVIYGDTDSIFVHIGEAHDKTQARLLGDKLEKLINKKWHEHIESTHKVKSKLEIEFETHFSKFFMPTIRGLEIGTKKRYAGLIKEKGTSRLVFKGLETVRTDWTQLAKDFQQELYRRVFNEEPVVDFILKTVENVRKGKLNDKLVYRKRIRRKLSEYQKNIPPHIKAARAADELNASNGKQLKYQKRGWIEYVMTLQGPQAIEHQSASLDYQLYIDRQLKSVADAILPFIDLSFDQITDNQLNLFQ
ncbi:DNA polymerase II [Thalassotalea sp. M1531]|uniref:DNA polymerase n=1 Tax=Thalassotalea algicola TaxID=2716224 RepID=A0A7Y0LD77_9GAMM|nr:DNA polymerase II [Thalassotalea algicola]NMP32415.1 DNA polymerase II [Thalassotalea algicola]